jgi:tRNA threonylcarbamoyladenosine biosynthesis protein TsaE
MCAGRTVAVGRRQGLKERVTATTMGLALTFDLASETATAALAAKLAAIAQGGDVIALMGPLGAGKTSFARGFIRALCGAKEEVPSPTFTLVEIYERTGAPPIWHFDLYRLKQAEEVYELGFEEALAAAILLIEWPERLGSLLPREHLEVRLSPGATPNARHAELVPSAAWRDRLRGLAA